MALANLKNAGLLDSAQIDAGGTKAVLLAAAPLGHGVFREIYDITYRDHGGKTVEVITSNEASDQECSMSDVSTFVVARRLGGDGEK